VASIERRVRNGKVSYSVRYRSPDGRSRRKDFSRKVDAQRWLHGNETAKGNNAWVDPAAGRVRLGEWAERWYATTAALRPTTRRDYRKLLDLEILPTFAAAPIASIDALAVREWLATLAAGGLGPKRAGKARAVLSQVLASAVEGGKLSRNVAAGVKPPKVQRAEMCFLDAGQVEALAEAIDPRYGTLIRFAAYSGLRPSELTALKVGRMDLLRGTVRVVEAATEVDGRLHWGGVKTHEARTVRLPRSVADDLGSHLTGLAHGPEDLVFPAPLGGPMRWSKWTSTPAALVMR
jgi:integrase